MIIQNEEALDKIMEVLATSEFIAFDFETRPSGLYPDVEYKEASLHHKMLEIEGLALRSEKLEPVYIPFDDTDVSRIYLADKLKELFSQDSLFIAHNIQFDAKVADYFFGARPKRKFCTLVGYWYLDENVPKDAKTLGKKHFGMNMIPFDEAKKLPKEEFYEYAKRDADVTFKLYFFLKEALEEKHFYLASGIEMDFIDVLIDMTLHGISCDLDYLKQGEEMLTNKAIELEAQIYKEYGEFNIGSPQQLCEKLYGIKVKRKKVEGKFETSFDKVEDYTAGRRSEKYAKVTARTKTGAPSTDDKALSRLDTPAAKLIQEYRSITKLLNTYAKGYQKYVVDGRIYPTFNNSGRESYQYGTVTGRLSSSAPNMQNISHEATEGWWLREAIHAGKGCRLIVADEAQLEIRLMAHFSKDKYLTEAIRSGEDVHLATAKLIFHKEDIDKEERRFAKTMNFSISYGQGIQAIAEALFKSTDDESKARAKQFRFNYFDTFPGVARWVERVGNRLVNPNNVDHHVKTIIGRKRRISELPIESPDDTQEERDAKRGQIARCKRQAVNSIIQGSASDVLKMAMIWITKEFKEKELDAHICLQIHDELVVECAEEIADEVTEIVKRHMEYPFNEELDVPLEVEPMNVYKWSEAKE